MQVYKYESMHVNASMQVLKYASMHVCKYAHVYNKKLNNWVTLPSLKYLKLCSAYRGTVEWLC